MTGRRAALRLARPRRAALRGAVSTASTELVAHQARRALRLRRDPGLRRPTGCRRDARRRTSRATSPTSTTPSRCSRRCPAGSEPIDAHHAFDELPPAAREYVEFVERSLDVPVSLVGVGPAAGPDPVRARRRATRRQLVKVLLVGSGGREHALALRLAPQRRCCDELHAAPGNPGIADARDVPPGPARRRRRARSTWPRELRADLVVVGPEAPLVAGLADALRAAGLAGLRARRATAARSRARRRSPRT